MLPRPPRSTRTDPLFPHPTPFRSTPFPPDLAHRRLDPGSVRPSAPRTANAHHSGFRPSNPLPTRRAGVAAYIPDRFPAFLLGRDPPGPAVRARLAQRLAALHIFGAIVPSPVFHALLALYPLRGHSRVARPVS